MRAWFYVKTPAASRTLDDGQVEKLYPYASKMKELKPVYKVDPLIRRRCRRSAGPATRPSH